MNGDTHWLGCRNMSRDEVTKWLLLLKSQQSRHIGTRLRKLSHTDHPSIQGPWTPFTFRDPKLNLADFPNPELSQPDKVGKTSYEELIELFEKQKLEGAQNVVVN